ncbi:hypothetical protein [Microvirga puerhi]|uniref:Uncharacterized protein n=1 Tax=Microvirga puerhi TaxID=2876078 RepID=A0ABS7VUK5_9HYPH|nr:hypothetical protein [Microvirga puerhi]MBZ6079263.1 hypothetical protein [Microvirga puerhi]
MISAELRHFIESAIDRQFISADDVHTLQNIVADRGLSTKSEAEALLALDRAVAADPSWTQMLTGLVVDFVVDGRAPAGMVEHEDALWLATVLDVGGHTRSAMEIAYAVLDRSMNVGAALLDFIMRGRQQEREQSIAA